MSKEINIERIEKYLRGQLSGAEAESFEKEMAENAELAGQVRIMRDLDEALQDENAIALQSSLSDIGQEFFKAGQKKEAKVISFRQRRWAIAASILFIVAAAALIWQLNSGGLSLSNDQLFAQYYQTEQLNPALRSGDSADSIYQAAIRAYDQKDYEAAISGLSSLLVSDPDNKQLVYALANAYLGNGQTTLAGAQFETIVTDGKSILTPDARWYLALIRIREGKIAEARQQLEQLRRSEDGRLAKRAEELLGQLDR